MMCHAMPYIPLPTRGNTKPSRQEGEKKRVKKLTPSSNSSRESLQALSTGSLIPTGDLSDTLVASRQEHDCQQRQQKGPWASDMPLAEDDAEVFGGPGEDHLGFVRVVSGQFGWMTVNAI